MNQPTPFLNAAVADGYTVEVKAVMLHKLVFSAKLKDSTGTVQTGNIAMSITDAILNLEGAIKHTARPETEAGP